MGGFLDREVEVFFFPGLLSQRRAGYTWLEKLDFVAPSIPVAPPIPVAVSAFIFDRRFPVAKPAKENKYVFSLGLSRRESCSTSQPKGESFHSNPPLTSARIIRLVYFQTPKTLIRKRRQTNYQAYSTEREVELAFFLFSILFSVLSWKTTNQVMADSLAAAWRTISLAWIAKPTLL